MKREVDRKIWCFLDLRVWFRSLFLFALLPPPTVNPFQQSFPLRNLQSWICRKMSQTSWSALYLDLLASVGMDWWLGERLQLLKRHSTCWSIVFLLQLPLKSVLVVVAPLFVGRWQRRKIYPALIVRKDVLDNNFLNVWTVSIGSLVFARSFITLQGFLSNIYPKLLVNNVYEDHPPPPLHPPSSHLKDAKRNSRNSLLDGRKYLNRCKTQKVREYR